YFNVTGVQTCALPIYAGAGLRDGRGLDDIAHTERPEVSGDGGADTRVGHDHHGGRLVRAVGDQACGLLEENGHQASWGAGRGRLDPKSVVEGKGVAVR